MRTDLTNQDRLAFAATHLAIIFERRDGFLSDSDVLDVADAWALNGNEDDRRGLADALFTWLEGQS